MEKMLTHKTSVKFGEDSFGIIFDSVTRNKLNKWINSEVVDRCINEAHVKKIIIIVLKFIISGFSSKAIAFLKFKLFPQTTPLSEAPSWSWLRWYQKCSKLHQKYGQISKLQYSFDFIFSATAWFHKGFFSLHNSHSVS